MTIYERSEKLEERTTVFSEQVIELCRKCPKNTITIPIINQLMRSGTSVGANYCEANGAASRKDFKNKIFICKKESKETKYWLRLLAKSCPEMADNCRDLWKEAQEFTLLFSKIASSTK